MKDLQHGDLGSSWLHYPEMWFSKSSHFFFLSRLFNKILLIKCLKKIILVNLKFSNNSVYTGQDELIPNMNFTQVRRKLFTNNNHQFYLKHYRKDIFKRILFYKWQPNCRTKMIFVPLCGKNRSTNVKSACTSQDGIFFRWFLIVLSFCYD